MRPSLARVAGAAALTLALVAGGGIAAVAADGDGTCTITLALPATSKPGSTFTLTLTEDSDCAGVTDPPTFTYGGLMTSRGATADDGIRFTHTIGSGNFSYQGVTPGTEFWHPWFGGAGVQGVDFVTNTMLSTWGEPSPAPTPTPTPVQTTAPAPAPTAAPTPPVAKPAPVKHPAPGKAKTAPSKKHRYANCKAVHRVYSGGIAKAHVARNQVKGHHSRALHGKVLHSTVAYKKNKRLDRDHDGVVCEH